MIENSGKIEWFGGNQDALNIYRMFIDLLHTWDDLVDKDKLEELSEDRINRAFLICLAYLPANPYYQRIQMQILPMWVTVVAAYATANSFERAKDEHGIELAHMLRYSAGNIIAYIVIDCVGAEVAKQILPEVWKAIACERLDDYRKEHLPC